MVVKDAVTRLPPIGFVGWRFLIGAVVLFAIARPRRRTTVVQGSIAGVLLFAGYAFQTTGLVSTSASNSGLVTGLYVVFTPLLAAAVGRRLPRVGVVAGAIVAFGGLAALTLDTDLRLGAGDAWTLACAAAFAGHIVYLSRVARHHPVIALTAVQLAVTGALGLVVSALTEDFALPGRSTAVALLVTGVAVSAGAFILQVWSQTVIGASRTALVLTLEPVFAALTGAVVLGERLGLRGAVGAGLILIGIYVVLLATADEDDPDGASLEVAEALSPAH